MFDPSDIEIELGNNKLFRLVATVENDGTTVGEENRGYFTLVGLTPEHAAVMFAASGMMDRHHALRPSEATPWEVYEFNEVETKAFVTGQTVPAFDPHGRQPVLVTHTLEGTAKHSSVATERAVAAGVTPTMATRKFNEKDLGTPTENLTIDLTVTVQGGETRTFTSLSKSVEAAATMLWYDGREQLNLLPPTHEAPWKAEVLSGQGKGEPVYIREIPAGHKTEVVPRNKESGVKTLHCYMVDAPRNLGGETTVGFFIRATSHKDAIDKSMALQGIIAPSAQAPWKVYEISLKEYQAGNKDNIRNTLPPVLVTELPRRTPLPPHSGYYVVSTYTVTHASPEIVQKAFLVRAKSRQGALTRRAQMAHYCPTLSASKEHPWSVYDITAEEVLVGHTEGDQMPEFLTRTPALKAYEFTTDTKGEPMTSDKAAGDIPVEINTPFATVKNPTTEKTEVRWRFDLMPNKKYYAIEAYEAVDNGARDAKQVFLLTGDTPVDAVRQMRDQCPSAIRLSGARLNTPWTVFEVTKEEVQAYARELTLSVNYRLRGPLLTFRQSPSDKLLENLKQLAVENTNTLPGGFSVHEETPGNVVVNAGAVKTSGNTAAGTAMDNVAERAASAVATAISAATERTYPAAPGASIAAIAAIAAMTAAPGAATAAMAAAPKIPTKAKAYDYPYYRVGAEIKGGDGEWAFMTVKADNANQALLDARASKPNFVPPSKETPWEAYELSEEEIVRHRAGEMLGIPRKEALAFLTYLDNTEGNEVAVIASKPYEINPEGKLDLVSGKAADFVYVIQVKARWRDERVAGKPAQRYEIVLDADSASQAYDGLNRRLPEDFEVEADSEHAPWIVYRLTLDEGKKFARSAPDLWDYKLGEPLVVARPYDNSAEVAKAAAKAVGGTEKDNPEAGAVNYELGQYAVKVYREFGDEAKPTVLIVSAKDPLQAAFQMPLKVGTALYEPSPTHPWEVYELTDEEKERRRNGEMSLTKGSVDEMLKGRKSLLTLTTHASLAEAGKTEIQTTRVKRHDLIQELECGYVYSVEGTVISDTAGTFKAEFVVEGNTPQEAVRNVADRLPKHVRLQEFTDGQPLEVRQVSVDDKTRCLHTDASKWGAFHYLYTPSLIVHMATKAITVDRVQKAKDTLKDDMKEIALRTGVKRIRGAVADRVTNFWASKHVARHARESNEDYAARVLAQKAGIGAFFASEAGQAALAYIVGMTWAALSEEVKDDTVREYGDLVAREIRVQGGTDLLDGFVEEVVTPIVASLTEGSQRVRVLSEGKATTSVTKTVVSKNDDDKAELELPAIEASQKA